MTFQARATADERSWLDTDFAPGTETNMKYWSPCIYYGITHGAGSSGTLNVRLMQEWDIEVRGLRPVGI